MKHVKFHKSMNNDQGTNDDAQSLYDIYCCTVYYVYCEQRYMYFTHLHGADGKTVPSNVLVMSALALALWHDNTAILQYCNTAIPNNAPINALLAFIL